MTPAEIARRHAPVCPVCKNAPNRRAKCKCCAGAGVVGVAELERAITEERDRWADSIHLAVETVKDIAAVTARGERPRVVSVEPGGS